MRNLLVVLFFVATGAQAQSWYKGNLHTHSYWSDGDEFPEMIIDWYKSRGYQFVALSDHNTLNDGEKWKLITKSETYMDGFNNYLKKYGKKWVVYKEDTGRVSVKLKTLKEYRPLFEDRNFLLIQAEELTDKFGDKHVHMGAVNLQKVIPAQGGNSVQDVIQRNLDAIIQQRKETGVPILQHLNHPNFFYSVTKEDIINVNGERFFEVYNGHHLVNNLGDSSHPGTESMWDDINIAYINQGKQILYGIASDDSHNYHMFGPTYSNAGRGWVMVRSKELTPAALITSMEAGDFYASTGVVMRELFVKGNMIHIEVEPERDIFYNIDFIGVRKGQTKSEVLATFPGPKGQFEVTKDYLFVRAKVTSTKKRTNPIEEVEYESAWVQPVVAK